MIRANNDNDIFFEEAKDRALLRIVIEAMTRSPETTLSAITSLSLLGSRAPGDQEVHRAEIEEEVDFLIELISDLYDQEHVQ